MSTIAGAFEQLGVDPSLAGAISAATSLATAIDAFGSQQTSPGGAQQLRNAITSGFNALASGTGSSFQGSSGNWESVHYADDLVSHQPKFKFLFKVKFEGFPGGTFERYVQRCDKPKVQLNHADVNYYNFRSKVLTSVTFAPLTITFLDEIGDTVNKFFRDYLKKVSYQAVGGFGIDKGNSTASSSKPYDNAYSLGRRIIVQQIFANGLADNKFIFKNPRIESFDFDELSMEDNAGSMMSLSFHYDALECETGGGSPVYNWGNTDIGAGGGSSNFANGGSDTPAPQGGSSFGSPLQGRSSVRPEPGSNPDISKPFFAVPSAIRDLVNPVVSELTASVKSVIGSAETIVDRGVRETLDKITRGASFNFSQAPAAEDPYKSGS